jgi:hypothetical protein
MSPEKDRAGAPRSAAGPNSHPIASDFSIFVDRLDGLRQTSATTWIARCPAHKDRTPSLSIRETADRLLIRCHTDCAAEDVLTAVGLTFRDLYRDPWTAAARAATANRGRRETKRLMRAVDPLDIERRVIALAAADIKAGKTLSVEDRARVALARERLGVTS